MNLSAWRIVKQKHLSTAFIGDGARLYGGRWNSPGSAMVYAASSASLAALEMLVHLDGPRLLGEYALVEVVIAKKLMKSLDVSSLPNDWRESPGPETLRMIGDDWLRARRSVALRVPSAIVEVETSVLLNPGHPDFAKLDLKEPTRFSFDPRLLRKL